MARPSRRLFDAWSRVYDAEVAQRLVYRPVQDAVVARLRPAEVVVDLGCGTGQLARRLARSQPRALVVGCDLSAGMLAQAVAGTAEPAAAPASRWVQADALALPLRDGSCDAVACTESFHWYPDQAAALAEVHRVLRPGGQLLVALVAPHARAVGGVVEVAARAVGQPFRWRTRREMASLLDAAGFVVEHQGVVRRVGAAVLPTALTVATRR